MTQRPVVRSSEFGTQDIQGYQMNGGAHDHRNQQGSNTPNNTSSSTSSPPMTLSAHDVEALLNADIGAGVQIDTKDLCEKISFEITERAISQLRFSERILQRSQGTLSQILIKPKPWHILRKGRTTYIRMHNWLSQPLETRMAILSVEPEGVSETTPAKRKSSSEEDQFGPKRKKHVFTEIQLIILEKILKENRFPDTELKELVGDHLGLEYLTIHNFFKNARRRPARVVEE